MSTLAPPSLDRPAPNTPRPQSPTLVAPRPPRRSGRWWRVPARVWVRRVHLWATLSVGLLLLSVTTSGAAIVLRPELDRLLHADLYEAAPSATRVGIDHALGAIQVAFPGNPVAWLTPPRRGLPYEGELSEPRLRVLVDPGTGTVRGAFPVEGGLLGWLETFHVSLFADETEIPLVGWNLATTLLGVSALALLLMVITGAVLWWPGVRRFVLLGFGVRLRRNAYTAHHDLHKVLGFVALPPLLVWGLTGANFEYYEETRAIWYALTPGDAPADPPESASAPGSGPGITAAEAGRRALAAVPGARLQSIAPPADETAPYLVWLARGVDPYEHFPYPGYIGVYLDRFTGDLLHVSGTDFPNATTAAYEQGWTFALHAGTVAPWYLRLLWILFGLAPLFLAVTGVAMWWLKRRGKRRPTRARATPAHAAPIPAD